MTTAQAVVIEAPGGPEVLAVARREVPDPGPGEIRLAVRAAAVNPTDVVLRDATEAVLREARGGIDVPPPWVPGMDAAGEVDAVGPGVERLAVGDQVMAAVSSLRPEGGAQCELIVIPEASAVPVPVGMSLVQAATLPMNGLTAILGLEQLALTPGQTIAVTGGAGLLASYVIALAKERGLRVVADARPEDEALVKGFGADLVVPRGDDFGLDVRSVVPEGVDAVYDTALLYDAAVPAIREGGAIAVVRGRQGLQPDGIAVHEVWVLTALERSDWLQELSRLAASRRIQLRVAATFPPERADEAHRLMSSGGLRGRAVIVF